MDTNLISQMLAINIKTILGLSLQTLLILVLIDLVLKGLAMWRASEKREKVWFWILLITNTFGILPLIYLIIRRKK